MKLGWSRQKPPLLLQAAASLAAGLFLAGCAPKPVAFRGPKDVRVVEVEVAEAPPMEVYYYRRQPPGIVGYLGTAALMGSTIYRSWADSRKTERLKPHVRKLKPAEELLVPFIEALRASGAFRRVSRRGADGRSGVVDARIELMIDRWGLTYATEGKLWAEAVVEGRMRSVRGEALFWRLRMVETDGTQSDLESLAADGKALRAALRRTLQAAAKDLARDLLKGLKPARPTSTTPSPQDLLPPEM